MKRRLLLTLMCTLVTAQLPVWGDVDEARMERWESETPADASHDAARVAQLAKQFNVTEATVQKMHDSGLGWGAINNQLAMAQELMKENPKTYTTMDAALAKISALRAQGMGYGLIAKKLGFKLGPVVAASRHARDDMRRMDRPAVGSTPDVSHPDHPEHPDHPVHPDHDARPEHPNHGAH